MLEKLKFYLKQSLCVVFAIQLTPSQIPEAALCNGHYHGGLCLWRYINLVIIYLQVHVRQRRKGKNLSRQFDLIDIEMVCYEMMWKKFKVLL